MARSSGAITFLLTLVAGALGACGGETPSPSPSPPVAEARSADPRAAELRRLVEHGAVAAARPLLAQLAPRLGAEAHVLAARLAAVEGDAFEALRLIEVARGEDPDHPEVYATAAELYAGLGRLDAARRERERGLERLGERPEFTRALGVIALATPGAARTGLEQLERARREAPELAFTDLARAEGHLLLGRAALLRLEPRVAHDHAIAGCGISPADPDLRQLLADAKASLGDLASALAIVTELHAEGSAAAEDLSRLHHAAATQALVRRDRASAIEHYAAARALGMVELGFGNGLLAEEAERAVAMGRDAYERAEAARAAAGSAAGEESATALAEAEDAFRSALRLDPDHLEALDLLGSVEFRSGRYEEAARTWTAVRERLIARGMELPYPVHLNAARAWRLAGRADLARREVEEELARRPDAFADEAREFLARLADAPKGGG